MDNRHLIIVTPETIGEKKGTFYVRGVRKDGRNHVFEHINNTYYVSDTFVNSNTFVRDFYGIPFRLSRRGFLVFGTSPDGCTACSSIDWIDQIDNGVTYVIRNDGRVLRVHVQTVRKALAMAELSVTSRDAKAEIDAIIAGAVPFGREAV